MEPRFFKKPSHKKETDLKGESMKKIMLVLLTMVILSGYSSSGTTTVVTVTWTSANIRSNAGNEFPVLMTVNKGDKLTIIGERGEWFNVRLEDGKEGWINSRVVKRQEYAPEKPITSAPTTFSSGTTKILTWDFSVAKSGPGSNYPVIATFRKGDKLTLVEQSGEWVKVRSENNQVGWIKSNVLE
jgi:N-acetylmuramoyl-L-alanine amidase